MCVTENMRTRMKSHEQNCGITIEHFAYKVQCSLTCQIIKNYTLKIECHYGEEICSATLHGHYAGQ